jgi:hypothetical protein
VTEAEWLACEDPLAMLRFLHDARVARKLRLFACACRRRISGKLFEKDRAAIEEAERIVEEPGGTDELDRREIAAGGCFYSCYVICYWAADPAVDQCSATASRAWNAAISAALDSASVVGEVYFEDSQTYGDDDEAERREQKTQAELLRDIFGNPFRPVAFAPEWRTDTAVALARRMYESRDFGAMPILADALQDAGCDNEDILAHCRDTSLTHVRGCWVVDLVLGKQ